MAEQSDPFVNGYVLTLLFFSCLFYSDRKTRNEKRQKIEQNGQMKN